MRRVRSEFQKSQSSPAIARAQLAIPLDDGTGMVALIQALIPLGLKAVQNALTQEVIALAGARYAHEDEHPR